jgi:lysozyme
MKISQKGVDLIKAFESFRAKAYICPAGLLTTGYGTVIDTAEEQYLKTKVLTEPEASELLGKELTHYESQVYKMTGNIDQCKFDALVSFAFNCGNQALRTSTLLKKVKINPNDPTIANEFNKWVNGGGKKLPGLVRRRASESHLYFKNEVKLFQS